MIYFSGWRLLAAVAAAGQRRAQPADQREHGAARRRDFVCELVTVRQPARRLHADREALQLDELDARRRFGVALGRPLEPIPLERSERGHEGRISQQRSQPLGALGDVLTDLAQDARLRHVDAARDHQRGRFVDLEVVGWLSAGAALRADGRAEGGLVRPLVPGEADIAVDAELRIPGGYDPDAGVELRDAGDDLADERQPVAAQALISGAVRLEPGLVIVQRQIG